MKITRNFLLSFVLSFIGGLGFLSVYAYISLLFFNHWSLVLFRCSKCMDSFWLHFLSTDQFLISGTFILMSFLFVRTCVFLVKEFRMQLFVNAFDDDIDFHLVDNFSESALVAGVWSPKIFVNKFFWFSLDENERKALIKHEKAHVKFAHGMQFVFLGVIKNLYGIVFFQRYINSFIEDMKFKSELEADEYVLRYVDKLDLVNVLYKGMKFEVDCLDSISVVGINTAVIDRVKFLVGEDDRVDSKVRFLSMYGMLSIVAFGFGFIISVIQPLAGCIG